MNEILEKIVSGFLAQSGLEVVAVICAVLYLVLVIRENIWCWFFAFVSTAIFIYLFHQVSLLSESILNVYYLVMAIYGWWKWQNKDGINETKITNWQVKTHGLIIVSGLVLAPIVGYLMADLGASFPYLDAFVAIFSVFATVMVAYKVFENWYYWLVVDTLSIYLFWQKQLYFVAALYMAYLALIYIGIKAWKKTLVSEKK